MPNFKKAQDEACKLLLYQKNVQMPISIEQLNIYDKTIFFDTLQDHAEKTGVSVDFITSGSKLKNGYVVCNGQFGLILSNKADCQRRQHWTYTHEIGHIILQHRSDTEIQEKEAHKFADHLLMPNALIRYMVSNGIPLTVSNFKYFFLVSDEAAKKKIAYIRRNNFEHPSDKDILDLYRAEMDRLIENLKCIQGMINETSHEICF